MVALSPRELLEYYAKAVVDDARAALARRSVANVGHDEQKVHLVGLLKATRPDLFPPPSESIQ